MVSQELSTEQWGPRPGEDWRAHRMRVFADHPEIIEVLQIAESPEHETEIWRERAVKHFEGDPEMQEIMRNAKFDEESTPEEDEEDIRIAKEGTARGVSYTYEEVMHSMAEAFPELAEELLSDL